jgi:hypothetical protein
VPTPVDLQLLDEEKAIDLLIIQETERTPIGEILVQLGKLTSEHRDQLLDEFHGPQNYQKRYELTPLSWDLSL